MSGGQRQSWARGKHREGRGRWTGRDRGAGAGSKDRLVGRPGRRVTGLRFSASDLGSSLVKVSTHHLQQKTRTYRPRCDRLPSRQRLRYRNYHRLRPRAGTVIGSGLNVRSENLVEQKVGGRSELVCDEHKLASDGCGGKEHNREGDVTSHAP